MLWISYEYEGRPIKRMGMHIANRYHRGSESVRFRRALLPFAVKVQHQGGGGLVVHTPQAEQKGARPGIEKSPHKAEQVVAAGYLVDARLAPAQRDKVALACDGKQIERS